MRDGKRLGHLALLTLLVIITRLPFRSHYLYEWDSVQYALSIRDFDIMWHQPHPPGYILFVLAIRSVHLFVGDENLSIILASIGFSILSVAFYYSFCTQFLGSSTTALWTSLLFLASPIFWFYGSTATVYTVEAFMSTYFGYLLWKSWISKKRSLLTASSLSLGIFAGFRPTSAMLLVPLWLYVSASRTRRLSSLLLQVTTCAVSTLIWFVPTIVNTRGFQNYQQASSGLTGSGGDKIAVFFGTTANYILTNLTNISVWLLQGLSPIVLGCLLVAVFALLREGEGRALLKSPKARFLALWVVPGLASSAVYTEKPGYLLLVIPPVLVAFSWSVIWLSSRARDHHFRRRLLSAAPVLTISFFGIWFVTSVSAAGIPKKLARASFIHQPPLSDYNWDISSREIRQRDFLLGDFEANMLDTEMYTPDQTIVFSIGGFPTWRHLMYYFPEYPVYWLVDESVSGLPDFNSEVYLAERQQVESRSGKPFWVPGQRPQQIAIRIGSSTRWLLWVADQNTDVYAALKQNEAFSKTAILPNGQSIVPMPVTFDRLDLGNFVLLSDDV